MLSAISLAASFIRSAVTWLSMRESLPYPTRPYPRCSGDKAGQMPSANGQPIAVPQAREQQA